LKSLGLLVSWYMMAVLLTGCVGNDPLSASSLPPPSVGIQNMPAVVKGNGPIEVQFSTQAADGKSIFSVDFEYAQDGNNFTSISTLPGTSASYSWSVPNVDLSGAKIKIVATDSRGFSTEQVSSAFAILSTAPQITQTVSPPSVTSGVNSMNYGGACESGIQVKVDLWTKSGSGSTTQFVQCASGTWSYSNAQASDGNYSFTFSQTDQVGHQTLVAATWVRDTEPPVITSGSFQLAAGASAVVTNHVPFAVQASDKFSNITAFCTRSDSNATPAASDPCWVPVSNLLDSSNHPLVPEQTLAISGNAFHLLGFIQGTYQVYIWVRSQVGLVSAPAQATITYNPGTPPVVINVIVASGLTPANPPSRSDLSVIAGSPIYIKWKIASAINGLGAKPISLYSTTDDSNYMPIAENVSNAANGGCALDSDHSGCFVGTAPSSGYFRIRVAVQDIQGMVTFSSGPAVNSYPLSYLAGNTDPGLGATASSSMFFGFTSNAESGDPGSFVMTDDGTAYYRDIYRGILVIDPTTGIVRQLFSKAPTGITAIDGSYAAGGVATLRDPQRMALDYKNGILVYDYDRIRRIDLTAQTITTLIGGSTSSADSVDPLAVKFTPAGQIDLFQDIFTALPDGRILFMSEPGAYIPSANPGMRIRVYNPNATDSRGDIHPTVTSIRPNGLGAYPEVFKTYNYTYNDATDITKLPIFQPGITFDPTTGSITSMQLTLCYGIPGGCLFSSTSINPTTGTTVKPFPAPPGIGWQSYAHMVNARNGDLYSFHRGGAKLVKFNPSTGTWTTLLGTGVNGQCADLTPALSCAVDLQDVFVGANGQIYFVDRGRIRAIDSITNPQNPVVITIMGQGFAFGDGGYPLSARFNAVNSLAFWSSDQITPHITLIDQQENRIREFSLASQGLIQTIAGNGSNALPNTTSLSAGLPITTQSSGVYWDSIAANPATGDVYYSLGTSVAKLDRSSARWEIVAGANSGTYFTNADGLPGNQVDFSQNQPGEVDRAYPGRMIAFDATHSQVLSARMSFNPLYTNSSGVDTGTNVDSFLLLFDTTSTPSARQTTFMGAQGPGTGAFCADGGSVLGCSVPYTSAGTRPLAVFDSLSGQWVLLSKGTAKLRAASVGGTIGTLTTLAKAANSFYYHHLSDGTNMVYYCATDGKLYQKNLAVAGSADAPIGNIAWPSASLTCTGDQIAYDPIRKGLAFSFQQNGLTGIAEWELP